VFGDIPAVAKAMQMVSSGGYCACRICNIVGIYYHNTIPNARTGVVSGGHTYFPLKLPNDYEPPGTAAPAPTSTGNPGDLKLRTHAEFKETWERLKAPGLLKKDAKGITQSTGKFEYLLLITQALIFY
jgi:hypothetical protein